MSGCGLLRSFDLLRTVESRAQKHHCFSLLQPQNHSLQSTHTVFLSWEILMQYISESRMFPKEHQLRMINSWDHSNTPSHYKLLYSGGNWLTEWCGIFQRQKNYYFFTKRVTSLTLSKLMGRMVEDDCSPHQRIHNKFPLNVFLYLVHSKFPLIKF